MFKMWSTFGQVIRHERLQVGADRTSAGLTVKIEGKEYRVEADYVDADVTGLMFFRV